MDDTFLGYPPYYVYDWLKRKALSDPFCISALTDGKVKMTSLGSGAPSISLIYSLDNKSWSDWDHVTGTELVAGQKLYLKAKTENAAFGRDWYNNNRFTTTCKFSVSGNIMSLLYNDFRYKSELISGYTFVYLFYNCSTLVSASMLMLPATTLSNNCYDSMFQSCTSLTAAPALPATTLAEYCYNYMFSDCTSLTTAPTLSATRLAKYCYNCMFQNCTSLTAAPTLPATTLADFCYRCMFYNCSSLTAAPALPATTLASYCYSSMFYNCTQVNELHYASSVQTDTTFMSMSGTPWFGAKNATVYYDL